MPPITKKEFLARQEELWEIINQGIEEEAQKYQDEFVQKQFAHGEIKILTREESLAKMEALAKEDPEVTQRRIEARRKIQAEQIEAYKRAEAKKRSQERRSEPQS